MRIGPLAASFLLVLGLGGCGDGKHGTPAPGPRAPDAAVDADAAVRLVAPRGALRRDDLRTYEIHVPDGMDLEGWQVAFHLDDVRLFAEDVDAQAKHLLAPLPAAVVRCLDVGDVVTWGLVPGYDIQERDGAVPVLTTFERAPDFPWDPSHPEALPPIDLRDPEALRDLAARVGLSMPARALPLPHEVGRGWGGEPALLFPRGPVLRSRLRWMAIDVDRHGAGGTLTFARDGVVVHQATLPGSLLAGLTYLPDEVLAAAEGGDEITWSFAPNEGGDVVTARFRVVDDAAAEAELEALRLDPRLGAQVHGVRSVLQAEACLGRGLVSDALQCALMDLSAHEGPLDGRPVRERPTFFRLVPFFPPPAPWRPRGFEASLAARAALACGRTLGLLHHDRCTALLDKAVWIRPEEAAARVAAFAPLVRGDLSNLREDVRETSVARLLGPGRWSPVWCAGYLDEVLELGGPALGRFLDLERHAEAIGEPRTLPAPESLVVGDGPAREVLAEARRHLGCGRDAQAAAVLRDLEGQPDSLLAYRVAALQADLRDRRQDAHGALDAWLEAARIAAALPILPAAQDALAGAERAAIALDDLALRIDVVERRIALDERAGLHHLATQRRADLGIVAYRRGRLGDALLLLREAHAACHGQPGWQTIEAKIGLGLGAALVDLGAWPEALKALHKAYDTLAQSDGRGEVSLAALTLAIAYAHVGALEQAEHLFDTAAERSAREGDTEGLAYVQAGRANVRAAQGRDEEARTLYEEAIQAFTAMGDDRMGARLRCALGDLLLHEGRSDDARRVSREAGERARAAADDEVAVMARANEGEALVRLGRTAEGVAALEEALARARAGGHGLLVVEQEARLARVLLAQARIAEALARVREGALAFDRIVDGIGTTMGPAARERGALLVRIGIDAAARSGDLDALFAMLERGRAQTVAGGLLGADAAAMASVPDGLREQARDARQRLREASDALTASRRRGDAAEIRAREAGHHEALQAHTWLAERLADAEARGRPSLRPPPQTIADVQAQLAPDEALVLYGGTGDRLVALVLEPGAVRQVDLGPSEAIATCARHLLEQGQRPGARGAAVVEEPLSPERDALAVAAELRTRVVAPLHLDPDVRRVLVSPTGVLGYVPFGLLLPGKPVVCLPSAAALVALRTRTTERGSAVLALGDPDYAVPVGGTRAAQERAGLDPFPPLPGTRAEAQAIGDVVLLGAQATRAGLTAALGAHARWRALHLGCHGLVDPQRPTLCSLALTADVEHHGLLTVLDVLRLPLAADLVTLSACQTGRGRLYRTEGIVGLTSAFLRSGARCVLCSQWKADDASTRELMVRFYELWNPRDGQPGLDADEALRQAQAHVRAQARWADPYYWAAWVQWGLPP